MPCFAPALAQATRFELVSRNVAALVKAPRVAKYTAKTLDENGARAFLATADGHSLGALFTVALALSLRLGEALGVRWSDVDLDAGTLRVALTLQRFPKSLGGGLRLVEPKSEQSRRVVHLPAFAIAALREYRSRQLEDRLSAGAEWRKDEKFATGGDWEGVEFVFTTRTGTPLDERNVRAAFTSILSAAGLERIRVHGLRHTCATILLAQGEHPRVVMETLGHSQISLTLDTYSHVMPRLQKQAAEKMDLAIGCS